jgi:hypothetical protein
MFGIVSKDTPIDLRIIILGIVLLILCGFMFKILFTILHHRLLMILFGIQQGDSMNLNNIGEFARNGGGDKHIVFDAMWASLRDSRWASITVPVFDYDRLSQFDDRFYFLSLSRQYEYK